jgi:lipoic acid synthetase
MAEGGWEVSMGTKPEWLRVRHTPTEGMAETRAMNRELSLRTVCDSAHCPNIGECWRTKSATYLIMGDHCTRHCRFCAVAHGTPDPLDPDEPRRVAEAVSRSGLEYVVITSVTRDDLPDGGASHFAGTISAIKARNPDCLVELLIPDLRGDRDALGTILESAPDVLGHNIEVVRRLQPLARDRLASYERSLELLHTAKQLRSEVVTKSSLMLGLGETEEEVQGCLQDLVRAKVDILTVGQYLRPSLDQLPVDRYPPPEEFASIGGRALGMGFKAVLSGPFVRSSYRAKEAYQLAKGE